MSDQKHIDRLFQEKLKNFEVMPDEVVWNNIHDTLHKDKRKRRVIPLWWKFGGVAALLLLLLTVGNLFFNESFRNATIDPVVGTPAETINPKDETNSQQNGTHLNDPDAENKVANEDRENTANDDSQLNSNTNTQNTTIVSASKNSENQVVDNQKKSPNNKENNSKVVTTTKSGNSINRNSKENNNTSDRLSSNIEGKSNATVATTSEEENKANIKLQNTAKLDELIKVKENENTASVVEKNEDEGTLKAELKEIVKSENTIEDAIAEAENKDEKEEKKLSRWNISPNVAPVYFNTLGEGSPIDDQFINNTKEGEVNMSYGIGGSYAINDRLKIRAGINKLNLGYGTNNIISFKGVDSSSVARQHLENINVSDDMSSTTFISAESLDRNRVPEIINTKIKGSLNQQFGFIEIPVEAEYAILNKKLAINFIGGFSTLIVDKNEVFSVVQGNKTYIGEADNINNLSYSANMGIGFNYNISDKIKINLEPTFKYQINTFSKSSGNFQPYFIGIYTGLSYKF